MGTIAHLRSHLPCTSYVFVRVLPEAARAVPSIKDHPSSVKPVGFVLLVNPSMPGKKLGLIAGFHRDGQTYDEASPLETAIVVVAMQIGLTPARERMYQMGQPYLGGIPESNWKYLYCADIYESERDRINPRYKSADGQMPWIMSRFDFYSALVKDQIVAAHRSRLEAADLIPTSALAMAV